MITLKENMQMVYDHKEPEYMPFMTDFNSAFLVGTDFVNERPGLSPGIRSRTRGRFSDLCPSFYRECPFDLPDAGGGRFL